MIDGLLKVKYGILLILPTVWLLGLLSSPVVLAAEQGGDQEQNAASFQWYILIKPLGVATLCVLCLTFLAGLFRRKLGRRFKKVHIALAITAVTLALSHALLILILFGL